jgi:hypothetical protein
MTGETPQWLRDQIGQAQTKEIVLAEVVDKFGQAKRVGQVFVVLRQTSHTLAHDLPFTSQKQWFVSQIANLAKKQQTGLERRLAHTAEEFQRLRPKPDETAAMLDERVAKILAKRDVASCFDVKVQEPIQIRKRYLQERRPGPQSPYELETQWSLSLRVARQKEPIEEARQQAGWRIHVTNATPEQMSLRQSIR